MSDDLKPLGDCDKPIMARIRAAMEKALAREDWQEPTVRCPTCSDTGFVVREDSLGRKFGARCQCLLYQMATHKRDEGPTFKSFVKDAPLEDDEGIPF